MRLSRAWQEALFAGDWRSPEEVISDAGAVEAARSYVGAVDSELEERIAIRIAALIMAGARRKR